MRRALIAGALVALALAFYGAQGPPEAPPHPMQSAVPGEACWYTGALGAYADHAFVCDEGQWRQLP